MDKLRIATFNCRSAKSSLYEIKKLCSECDIIFLQETWLSSQEYHILESIDSNFYVKCTTAMDIESGILRGRPYGGCAILWRKDLHGFKGFDMPDCNSRAIGLEIICDSKCILLVNVYMPYERHDNNDEFIFYLSQVNGYIQNHPCNHSAIIGDFNSDIRDSNSSKFTHELYDFCSNESFTIADKQLCDDDSFTFLSEAHNTVHWIDHFLLSNNLMSTCDNIYIDYGYVTSDHYPVIGTFNMSCLQNTYNSGSFSCDKVPWDKLSDEDLHRYSDLAKEYLDNVVIDRNLLLCRDIDCDNPFHISATDQLYHNIVDSLSHASRQFANSSKKRHFNQVAGWNDYCSASHSDAREAFLHWVRSGKPRQGLTFDDMKKTRAYFKYTLRLCKANLSKNHADSLARKLLSKDTKQFWKEIKKLKGDCNNNVAFTIENVSGEQNICNLWKDHYESILNSSKDTRLKSHVMNELSKCTLPENNFTFDEVRSSIRQLKGGKASGRDGLQSEHFKFGPDSLIVYVCMLFNCMVVHGHIPTDFMDTFLTPIVKDKKGDSESKDNYRPLAVTSILSKIFETVILNRYQDCLITCYNQFGFKNKHSTDLCTFTLKHVIDFYQSMSSPLFICYLDASKAFDRLNFWVLFDKLLKRGMPVIIVRILIYWYTSQNFYVRWGSSVSEAFKSSNGTRQGGVISPHFFNVYVDDLSSALNELNVGCFINHICINHLMYADDTVLIAPSVSILQHLILVCEKYASTSEIIFNVKKTVYMCIKSKIVLMPSVPKLLLLGQPVKLVDKYKYLGVIMTSDCKDDADISKLRCNLYSRGNSVIRNFKSCSDDVKTHLFKTYCTSFYCSHLWCKFTADSLRRIKVAYNRVFRILMNLKHRISISSTFLDYNVHHFDIIMRNAITGFIKRLESSENNLVQAITKSQFYTYSGLFTYWKTVIF